MNRKQNLNGNIFKKTRWVLVFYDIVLCFLVSLVFYVLYPWISNKESFDNEVWIQCLYHFLLNILIFISIRFVFKVYAQIWRYGGISSYIRLLCSDFIGIIVFIGLEFAFTNIPGFRHVNVIVIIASNLTTLLLSISLRMFYRFAYRYLIKDNTLGHFLTKVLKLFGATDLDYVKIENHLRIRIAIVGAGRTGVGLAEELIGNVNSNYIPKLFIDTSKDKSGRNIYDVPVILEKDLTNTILNDLSIQEIVIALPNLSSNEKKELFRSYNHYGCKLKLYDYPLLSSSFDKKTLREFDIEELLFRKPIALIDSKVDAYYKDKTILITGGGGSIGSELARQIANMRPKALILLDIYENGVYDVQQELAIKHKDIFNIFIEICSITNVYALEKVFQRYGFDIVIHAAAHKHVPLMEHNVIEAVENNILGTNNVIELVEKYKVGRFMLISTDKAVNPTNVMGATKRFCEINIFAHAKESENTIYSATRFGNVLGSAGSVIPLFKKQIASGGPVTLTHRDIIRYFMTIPEASRLVLTSGSMAKNGELFVLDMGQPIKIYDLAETMISLSGYVPGNEIKILETGLRPGEKLYEELLINSSTLTKTDNDLIYIEKDNPYSLDWVGANINSLVNAIKTSTDNDLKCMLKSIIKTYK